MSSLLAIDSGYPECAVAGALSKRLVFVGTMRLYDASKSTQFLDFYPVTRVVVEVPQSDGRAVPVDDLIRVATTGVRVAEQVVCSQGSIHEYRPREWKGSTPKPPHHARMWNALDNAEQSLLGGAKTHAAIHAACKRGALDGWKKPGATYYRAKEFPTVDGTKITHDILDAVALALYGLKRISKG